MRGVQPAIDTAAGRAGRWSRRSHVAPEDRLIHTSDFQERFLTLIDDGPQPARPAGDRRTRLHSGMSGRCMTSPHVAIPLPWSQCPERRRPSQTTRRDLGSVRFASAMTAP